MNFFDDIRKTERQTECQHLWILKDGIIYCYDCGKREKKEK